MCLLTFNVWVTGAAGQEEKAKENGPEVTVAEVHEDASGGETAAAETPYSFPVIKPEVKLGAGYRFVGLAGSPRADQYEYLHSSAVYGGEARIFELPHRFSLDLDVKNGHDYFGDLSYAYKDVILFRGINSTVFHNLNNIGLVDLNPATTPYTTPSGQAVDVRDPTRQYGVTTGMNSAFLRLKTPDFPLHVYVDASYVDKDGDRQQRSLQGSASFNAIVRTTQPRDVDWTTKSVAIGVNSHLGPVEIDFSHGEKRFDAGDPKALFDTYTQVGTGSNYTFPAGVWPHNLIPDLAGSSNTLKLHTSYAGGLVASATISSLERRNDESGAKTDYFIGGGEITWVPMAKLTFAVRYRHKEIDPEAQGNVPFPTLCSPSNNFTNNYTCLIKPTLSSISDVVSATARYRVVPGVTLRAEYRYEDVRRGNFDEWFVPQSTQRNIISLWADMRIVKNLNLKLKYTYKDINNPELNVEPDRSNELKASMSWIPASWVNALVSYRIAKEKRNNLDFVFTNPVSGVESLVPSPNDRDVTRDQFLASVTFLMVKDLSLTASYSYMHDRILEDLAYNDTSGNLLFDPNVPQTDMAQTYAIDAGYLLNKELSLHAGVSHTVSSSGFFPADPNILQPISIASFNAMKTRETVYSVSGEYRFKSGFVAGIQYRYSELQDAINNPYDDVNNGRAHIAMLTVTKKW